MAKLRNPRKRSSALAFIAAVTLVVFACRPPNWPSTADPVPPGEIGETKRAWVGTEGLPELGQKCVDWMNRFEVAPNLSDSEFIEFCGPACPKDWKGTKKGKQAACHGYTNTCIWGECKTPHRAGQVVRIRCDTRYVAIVHEDASHPRGVANAVHHEGLHLLWACSQTGHYGWDRGHCQRKLWCEGGALEKLTGNTLGDPYCQDAPRKWCGEESK